MTQSKMTSRPLSWMALDTVFFSIPDHNKEIQEENPVLPRLLAHGSSQVTLELPTVLRASLNLSAASRAGETEPQGNCLDFFWSPGNSTQDSFKRLPKANLANIAGAFKFCFSLGGFILTTSASSHHKLLTPKPARADKLRQQRRLPHSKHNPRERW